MAGTEALRAHLLRERLAGSLATDREKTLRRYRLFAAGDPRTLMGCEPERRWEVAELAELVARRCGGPTGIERYGGPAVIDPVRTLAGLRQLSAALAEVASRRAPVLLGTGHPDRLLGFYAGLSVALSAVGCPVLTPGYGRRLALTTRFGVRPHVLVYVRGVAFVREQDVRTTHDRPGAHTHSPLPLRVALAAAAEADGVLPQLVIGDHGWACGAGQLGFPVAATADVDDPAVFVAQGEGRVSTVVPLDDGVSAASYQPLVRYVLKQARLSH
ncbi:phosphatase [Streptomyces sp. NPDC059740]|uniref:phosphatase n=1 Tax=Streptomyces sp. NPDC059740 TaxID=3346926 RepID=UPI003663819B